MDKVFMKEAEKNIKVYAKWILAGEYSVLRARPALAFPLSSQFIKMQWIKDKEKKQLELIVEISAKKSFVQKDSSFFVQEKTFLSLFESVLEKALKKVEKTHLDLKGVLKFSIRICLGMGLGSSALICVLIGKLFRHLHWINAQELFSFCHSLENKLHGQSSGLDVATVLSGKPIFYQIDLEQKELGDPKIENFYPAWEPMIFLSFPPSAMASSSSFTSSSTYQNIQKVKKFWKSYPSRALKLDQQMEKAVFLAKKGLESMDKKNRFLFVKEAFDLAEDCFTKWNLIGKDMNRLIVLLKKCGALAVKPLGSGAGGSLLSLWDQPPPENLEVKLFSAF